MRIIDINWGFFVVNSFRYLGEGNVEDWYGRDREVGFREDGTEIEFG